MNDPVLDELTARAAADAETVGLILTGSRGAGLTHAESDYDLCWILTDASYARYAASGSWPQPDAGITSPVPREIWILCLSRLIPPVPGGPKTDIPDWMLPAFAESTILLDKTGEVARRVEILGQIPEDQRAALTAGCFDAYLNALYRSLKSWRRGNKLGGRLHAAATATHLTYTLFSLEGRRTPYPDHLTAQLHTLSLQGWESGYLEAALFALIDDGSPPVQTALAQRVLALLRDRGFGSMIDAWKGKIEAALAWTAGDVPPPG